MTEPTPATPFADATQMAATGEAMLELIGVQKFFGAFQALRDIDLNVARQEVVVVIGPSGSGKSTMIRCINRLEEHDGGRILVDGVELSREIARTKPLADLLVSEVSPGPDAKSRDAIADAVKKSVNTIFHPVGTCKMGNDEMAVVDAQLRVRGLEGLRVVDGSIMPTIVGGNTHAPIVMIAEKAADLMRARS